MSSRLLRLSALSAALVSTYAGAVGFGEVVLQSRVGEPLRAEVPLFVNAGEQIDSACFSLNPIRNSDLPVVTAARTRLVRNGQNYRLIITGSKPIAEPIFVVSLRAGCGIDLQRDFVMMPQAPLMLADAFDEVPAAPVAVTPSRKPANFREVRARDGDTLETIAEAQAPDDIIEQRRLLAAIKRANPNLSVEQLLPEGTAVRMPNLRQRVAAESDSPAEPPKARRTQAADTPPPPPKPKKAVQREASAAAPSKGADRIVLGTPPEELKAGEKAVAPSSVPTEVQERMLKLETTLQLLNQEVDKLNAALALTTEALAMQQKLQLAQTLQSQSAAPTIQAPVTAPPPANNASQDSWLELLLSAVIGGGIAAGMAHFLSRRRTRSRDDDMPLAVTNHRVAAPSQTPVAQALPKEQEFSTPPAPSSALTPAAAVVSAPQPEPVAESLSSAFSQSNAVSVDFNDGDSALELAEIMLSFGRVRGAAETLAVHIEESSPDHIQPWSMLLDLYRRGDMHSEFGILAEKMRKKFNVQVPAWDDSTTPVSGLKSLEDYAHIVWRTENTWAKQECMDYLYELVHDNRAGQRSGFPLEVVEEIALLMRVLEEAYGLTRPSSQRAASN